MWLNKVQKGFTPPRCHSSSAGFIVLLLTFLSYSNICLSKIWTHWSTCLQAAVVSKQCGLLKYTLYIKGTVSRLLLTPHTFSCRIVPTWLQSLDLCSTERTPCKKHTKLEVLFNQTGWPCWSDSVTHSSHFTESWVCLKTIVPPCCSILPTGLETF